MSHSPNVAHRECCLCDIVDSTDGQLDSSWEGQIRAWQRSTQGDRELAFSFLKADAVFILPLHRKARGDSS